MSARARGESPQNFTQSSDFLELGQEKLHVRKIGEEAGLPGVLLLHGTIEDGRIFYTESGRGLGPYLAEDGYQVWVPDLRGRGRSEPRIAPDTKHGQFELITEDVPFLIREMHRWTGQPIRVGMHSWGGVLVLSALARFPELVPLVHSLCFFGSKRSIHIRTMEKLLKIDLGWFQGGELLCRNRGYLRVSRYLRGVQDEPARFFRESCEWVKVGPWVDPRDRFDYGAMIQELSMPRSLFITGAKDTYLGHPQDVRALMRESGLGDAAFRIVGRAFGAKHDYGHIDLLTHRDAPSDHFPWIADWMRPSS
jgi:pimeloyl-ACP methyl ester carboxylesterase